nr:immunoglobulin light chain junction region [Macaca mulatta]
CQRYTSAPFTF